MDTIPSYDQLPIRGIEDSYIIDTLARRSEILQTYITGDAFPRKASFGQRIMGDDPLTSIYFH